MKRIQLEKDWLFRLENETEMRSVTVPHDWSTLYPIDENNPTGLGGGYAVAGVGFYTREFEISKEDCEKSVSICFDGVYQNATIFVNEKEVGKRAYGYSTFEVEITDVIVEGKNVLSVLVDNSKQPNSRWYTGSGILRPVYLQVKELVHYPEFPIFVKTNRIDYQNEKAYLEISTIVQNYKDYTADAYVKHYIYDAQGEIVATGSSNLIVESGKISKSMVMPAINNVKMWSADEPYLYTLKSVLHDEDKIVDEVYTKIGVREIEFDPNKGMLVNQNHEKIKGVCLHHDCGITGGVGYKETWKLKLQTLKDMGCNGIRCAHNPPCIEMLDLCDELGFYVMDEAFDEWQLGKVKHHAIKYSEQYSYGYSQFFSTDHEKDITTMLRRDRNHASIVLWSIGNEILEQSLKDGHLIAKELADICHREDPTRKITSACDKIAANLEFGQGFRSFENALDVVGYNYVDRWADRGEQLYDIDHKLFPNRCILGSENYSTLMIRGDYSDDREFSGFFRTANYRYSTMQHEHLWKLTSTRDYIIGDYAWTGIDYLGESAWPLKGGHCAPIDCAGFKKDTFYYYRSIWNEKATTLHIAPHWNWQGDEGEYKQVIVYTNCKQVSLYCNGKLVGTKGYEFPHRGRVSKWNELMSKAVQSTNDLHLQFDVAYEQGELLAIGYDDDLNEVIREKVVTVGTPENIVAKKLNDGKYVHFEIFATDKEGREVPFATNSIKCKALKGGKFIAMESGDMTDHTMCIDNERKMFAGKVLALFENDGDLEVEFTSENLNSCHVKI